MVTIKARENGTVAIYGQGPRVDKATACSADSFHMGICRIVVGPRGGVTRTGETWRRNGKTQTWKTRPEDFRTPIKFGLYRTSQLTPAEADQVHDASMCPIDLLTDEQARTMADDARVMTVPSISTDAAGNDGPTLN
jgi:hypothetical protein